MQPTMQRGHSDPKTGTCSTCDARSTRARAASSSSRSRACSRPRITAVSWSRTISGFQASKLSTFKNSTSKLKRSYLAICSALTTHPAPPLGRKRHLLSPRAMLVHGMKTPGAGQAPAPMHAGMLKSRADPGHCSLKLCMCNGRPSAQPPASCMRMTPRKTLLRAWVQ